MRCSVISNSGQVLSTGRLFLEQDDEGQQRLSYCSDRGKVVQGGLVNEDGDLADASQVLFRNFFHTWGISGITLTLQA